VSGANTWIPLLVDSDWGAYLDLERGW